MVDWWFLAVLLFLFLTAFSVFLLLPLCFLKFHGFPRCYALRQSPKSIFDDFAALSTQGNPLMIFDDFADRSIRGNPCDDF
jgi:hypothetical protein